MRSSSACLRDEKVPAVLFSRRENRAARHYASPEDDTTHSEILSRGKEIEEPQTCKTHSEMLKFRPIIRKIIEMWM